MKLQASRITKESNRAYSRYDAAGLDEIATAVAEAKQNVDIAQTELQKAQALETHWRQVVAAKWGNCWRYADEQAQLSRCSKTAWSCKSKHSRNRDHYEKLCNNDKHQRNLAIADVPVKTQRLANATATLTAVNKEFADYQLAMKREQTAQLGLEASTNIERLRKQAAEASYEMQTEGFDVTKAEIQAGVERHAIDNDPLIIAAKLKSDEQKTFNQLMLVGGGVIVLIVLGIVLKKKK